jgi:hypothetical protein
MIKNNSAIAKMNLYKHFSLPSTYASRWDYNDLWGPFYEVFFQYFLENLMRWEYKKTLEFTSIEQNKRLFERVS